MLRTLRLWLIALGATALANAGEAAPASGPERVVLPIVDFVWGAPVIEVRLNGGAPHRFKFDSGSMELIAGDKAEAEGIRPTGVTKLLEINKAETMPVSDTDLQVGELDVGAVSLALMPQGWRHPAAIDGKIGKTLLLRYVVTMDVAGRQLIVTRPDAYEVPDGAIVLPMAELHGLFHVPASLDGEDGEFGLDTGLANHVVVFPGFEQAHALDVRYAETAVASDTAGTSGQASRMRQAKGRDLAIGAAVVADPQVLLLGEETGVGRFGQMAGLIGMPALAQFTVTFDAPHKRLVLTPAAPSAEAPSPTPEAAPAEPAPAEAASSPTPPAREIPELPPEPPFR